MNKDTPKKFYYGGQAVIEGIMIRGRRSLSVSVRRSDGEIVTTSQPLASMFRGKAREIPFIRGLLVLIETLVLGTQTLFYSANVAVAETNEEIKGPALWGTLAASMAFAVGLFFVVPLLLINFFDRYIASSLVSNLLEGAIRLVIFVAYLKLMNLMPDIRRVFAYHGAEHKVVNAFEHGTPLEPAEVRRFSTAHVRCGTSFLLVVLLLSIVVFALFGRPDFWLRVMSRIVLVPVIAMIGYEFIRFAGRNASHWAIRAALAPGLLLQSLTTGEPDDRQLEVAISAMKNAVAGDAETNTNTTIDSGLKPAADANVVNSGLQPAADAGVVNGGLQPAADAGVVNSGLQPAAGSPETETTGEGRADAEIR